MGGGVAAGGALGPDLTGALVPVTDTLQRASVLPAGRYRVRSRGTLAGGVLAVSAAYDRADRTHDAAARVPRDSASGRADAEFAGTVQYVRPDSLLVSVTCGACVTTVGRGIRAVDVSSSYTHRFRVRPIGGGRVELREVSPYAGVYADTLEAAAGVPTAAAAPAR